MVTPQDRGVETLATDITYFHNELNGSGANRVCPFPAWETDPYAGLTPHADIQQARATALWRLRTNKWMSWSHRRAPMATRLAAPSQFDTYSLHVTSGEDLSQELLIEHLANAGYLRQEPVGSPGEFSVRGGIVDVFSPLMRNPVRIEFFGDSVDSIGNSIWMTSGPGARFNTSICSSAGLVISTRNAAGLGWQGPGKMQRSTAFPRQRWAPSTGERRAF